MHAPAILYGKCATVLIAATLATALSTAGPAHAQGRMAPASMPQAGHQTELSNGVPVENLSAPTDGQLAFFIDVPPDSGHLIIETSGGTGDADIYVGFEFEPTLVEFDCVGWLAGNDERCWFPIPDTGRYNILVHAYDAFEGLRLEASYSDERPEVTPLGNGQTVSVDVPAGQMNYYSFVVEPGSTDLIVEMRGGPDTTGDSELYVRHGAPPVQDEFYWDCRPWIDGNDETCIFEDPEPGLWYAGVEAWHEFGDVTDVTLRARWTTPATDTPGNLQVSSNGSRMRATHQLTWTGGLEVIDIWLNGELVHQGPNEGSHTHRVMSWQLPAEWQVCNTGTTDCTPLILAR